MEQQDIGDILDPKPDAVADVATDKPEADAGIPRDDRGRFAARAEQPEVATPPAPEPTGEKPAVAPPVAAPQSPPEGYVPLAALVDQRLEARQAKQRLQELERQLREAQTPKQEPVDFYTDPDAAFNQRLQQALNPFQTQLQQATSALFEERLHRIAGSDKAAKIEEEIGKAMESGDPDIAALSHALQTQGVAGVKALVDWYDRRSFDPAAKEAEIEARIMAKYGIQPGQAAAPAAPAAPPPVMPSNLAGARNVGSRSGPAWSGPPAISDIFKR
jgi:hypothetical protein